MMKVDLQFQKKYFNKQVCEVFDIYDQTTFRGKMLRKLDTLAIRRLLSKLDYNFKGLSILVVACGFGQDLQIWENMGARLTLTDISERSLELCREHYPGVIVEYADLNNLPYNNNSFDFCVVSMGLHHLYDPIKGIEEMYRVARKGIICYEMYSMVLTPLFERLNIQAKYEKSGNRAYRFSYSDRLETGKKLNAQEIYIKPIFLCKFGICQKVNLKVLCLADFLSKKENFFPRYFGNVVSFCFLK